MIFYNDKTTNLALFLLSELVRRAIESKDDEGKKLEARSSTFHVKEYRDEEKAGRSLGAN